MSETNIENKDEQNSTPKVEENTWVSRVSAIDLSTETPKEETKVDEILTEETKVDEVITTPNPVSDSEPVEASLGNNVETGAFSTMVTKTKPVKKTTSKKENDNDDVVVFSEKNLYFPGTGKITQGFNIVKNKQAKVYLRHKSVRSATPEELAEQYKK